MKSCLPPLYKSLFEILPVFVICPQGSSRDNVLIRTQGCTMSRQRSDADRRFQRRPYMATGIVKCFISQRGFGFIQPEDAKDVFRPYFRSRACRHEQPQRGAEAQLLRCQRTRLRFRCQDTRLANLGATMGTYLPRRFRSLQRDSKVYISGDPRRDEGSRLP